MVEYRIFRLETEWHWQVMEVMDHFTTFLASGDASSGHTARIAALSFCRRYQENYPAV
ncbi:MAG TPA: hypothetical protein VFL49_13325 [Pseudolabrys sp.]|nr:hypothetical protein [Pseudolabrys sp.]